MCRAEQRGPKTFLAFLNSAVIQTINPSNLISYFLSFLRYKNTNMGWRGWEGGESEEGPVIVLQKLSKGAIKISLMNRY